MPEELRLFAVSEVPPIGEGEEGVDLKHKALDYLEKAAATPDGAQVGPEVYETLARRNHAAYLDPLVQEGIISSPEVLTDDFVEQFAGEDARAEREAERERLARVRSSIGGVALI